MTLLATRDSLPRAHLRALPCGRCRGRRGLSRPGSTQRIQESRAPRRNSARSRQAAADSSRARAREDGSSAAMRPRCTTRRPTAAPTPLRLIELVYRAGRSLSRPPADPRPHRSRARADAAEREDAATRSTRACSSRTCLPTRAAACIWCTRCSSRSVRRSTVSPNSAAPARSISARRRVERKGNDRHRHAHQSRVPQRRGRQDRGRPGDRRGSRAARRRDRGRRPARRRGATPQARRAAASSMPAST